MVQRFKNPSSEKIEAVYLFPLPTAAAVNDLAITVGDHTIRGTIQERAKATQIYEAARGRGMVAALLTQERPNLFTQSIANLEPQATIEVHLKYVQRLDYEDGGYTVVFPMVVGPRYLPAAWKAKAAELQAPTLAPGLRSSHDISLSVDLDAGVAIEDLGSPSHQIAIQRDGRRAHVSIRPNDTIPNKDFTLRYQVAGTTSKLGVIAHKDGGDGSFLLMLQPPSVAGPEIIAPRELVFVLDTSSSMRGPSLVKAKELIRRMLWTLRPEDTFQIVRFSDSTSALGPGPISAKPKNVDLVLRWLAAVDAGGGTEMVTGIEAALAVPHDPLRLRILAFITDGYVGNEDDILKVIGKKIGASRLFAFGVGTAVNRYLLEEMASIGRGSVQFVRPDEDTGRAVTAFERRIDAPVLTDLKIDWNGVTTRDLTPAALPDLFLGQPLVLSGHYTSGGTGIVTVSGKQGGRPVAFSAPVVLPDKAVHPAIATVWARARIAELSRGLIRKADPAAERAIIALSIENRILTQFTAFVAVDESRVTAGASKRVVVPVEIPDAARNVSLNGAIGYGMSGGGYGQGYGSIAYGTIGHGSGTGYGFSVGSAYSTGYGPQALPTVQLAQPVVVGALDKTIIRRYVTRNLTRIRYCYQKELVAKPSLGGTVEVLFTITPQGVVSSSVATGVDKEVSTCIAQVVKTIEFPKAENSEPVQVHYPFQLQPSTTPTARQDAIKELFK